MANLVDFEKGPLGMDNEGIFGDDWGGGDFDHGLCGSMVSMVLEFTNRKMLGIVDHDDCHREVGQDVVRSFDELLHAFLV